MKLIEVNSHRYVQYLFTLDELYYLLGFLPPNDEFREDLMKMIALLEAEGEKRYALTLPG